MSSDVLRGKIQGEIFQLPEIRVPFKTDTQQIM